jgi:hypothetical protein
VNDPLISLITTAGVALFAAALWALSVAFTYWDIQRRMQAGQPVRLLAWMLVVVLLPLAGWAAYLIARLAARPAVSSQPDTHQTGSLRVTKFKAPASAQPPLPGGPTPAANTPESDRLRLPTILVSDSTKETVPARRRSSQARGPAPVRLKISVTDGPERGRYFLVDRLPAQIGRDFDSAIRLEQDGGVSRKHALVYQSEGRLRIRDLQSRHGTRVNGRPVMDQSLEIGDKIEVGLSSLVVRIADRPGT